MTLQKKSDTASKRIVVLPHCACLCLPRSQPPSPMHHHEAASVLGVHPGAPPDAVRAAYLRAARAAHPDLASPSDRAAAEASFKRVAQAYALMTRQRGGGTVEWAAAAAATAPRRATSFSNVAVALALSFPLAFAGAMVARSRRRAVEAAFGPALDDAGGLAVALGRRDGLLNPPVNDFLSDAARPRTAPARWSRWSMWGWGPAGPDTAPGRPKA